MKRWMPMAVAAAGLVASTAMSAPSSRYVVTGVTVTDLGTFGGPESMAWDINNGGNIVGWATSYTEKHAFYYFSPANYLYDIGLTTGIGPSEARGINNLNEVVGFAVDTHGVTEGFYWNSGAYLMLADDTSGKQTHGKPVAISDNRLMVGELVFESTGAYYAQATLWSDYLNFHALFVPKYPWPGVANDVNDAGQAVGREKDSEFAHRWQWSAAGVTDLVLPGLYLGVSRGDALGINAGGAVVGWDHAQGGQPHAYLWDGVGAPLDLGIFLLGDYSFAEDINNANFVVGYGDRWMLQSNSWVDVESAFIYHAHFGKYVLPKFPGVGFSDCRAHALNERQSASGLVQVVGYCTNADGFRRAVRWDVTVAVARVPAGSTPWS